MSNINTSGINVNYPVPGVNNNSQGFRDNFTTIKINLDTAYDEITDLQNKAIVKSALNNSSLNNDMGNTLISNALVRGFRATTYNLGGSLSGIVPIDVSLGDVQYGTIVGNTTLQFTKWAPSGTQSNVQLILNIANTSAVINFPDTQYDANIIPTNGMTKSVLSLENYASNAIPAASITATNYVTFPNGVTELHYNLTTTNCGTTIEIEPVNRSRKIVQVQGAPYTANISGTGTITTTTASTTVNGTGTLFTTEFIVGRVLLDSANTVVGTVASIINNTSMTLTTNAATAITNAAYRIQDVPIGNIGDVVGSTCMDANYVYYCTANYTGTSAAWKRIQLNSY